MFRPLALIGIYLLCGCLLTNCSKDAGPEPCNELIQVSGAELSYAAPLRYLPAHPGSWWRYSDSSMITTSSNYSPAGAPSTAWDANHGVEYCCTERMLYMPMYDGHSLYGYVRMRPDASGANGSACHEQLLSEHVGDRYKWGGSHYGRTEGRTMVTDTTIVLANGDIYQPCIMVKMVGGIASNYFDITPTYVLYFYARDVGLVKEVHVNSGNATTIELADHFIAN